MKTVVHAAIDWNDGLGGDNETAEQTTAHLDRALRQHHVARLVVIAYGPDGPARSRVMADALEGAFGVRSLQIHVHDGHGRIRSNTTGEWGRAVAVAGFVPRAALSGHTPAASRTELLESVAPLPAPLFGPLDPGLATKLLGSSPLLQAEIAQRALDTLAAGRVDDLQQMTVLSHLITTTPLTRDSVLVHAIRDGDELMDARTDALVRTFRAAPLDQRPQLASTTAAATFLAAWHPPIVQGLLRHADKDAELTALVSQAIRLGIDPRPMRPTLTQATNELLAEAETAWAAQRSTGAPASGRASIPPRTQPWPSTRHVNAAPFDSGANTRDL
ncbi:hypothetical protein [Promicromonospora umidemergens]|nr:hypothetical protein [Promicromonospora umidemergens]